MKLTEFGTVFREIRTQRKLRLVDVANRIDVSPAFISSVETGRKPVPADLPERIQEAFKLPKADFYRLKQAADRTLSSKRIRSRRPKEAQCVAALSRNLDRLTDEQLDFFSDYFDKPHKLKKMDPITVGLAFRRTYVSDRNRFDPIAFVEFDLKDLGDDVYYDVVDEICDDPTIEGCVEYNNDDRTFRLAIREDVYELASGRNEYDDGYGHNSRNTKPDGPSLFTICHEIAHLLLHKEHLKRDATKLKRGIAGSGTSFNEDPVLEAEANSAGGAILIPPEVAASESERDAKTKYYVSSDVWARSVDSHRTKSKRGRKARGQRK